MLPFAQGMDRFAANLDHRLWAGLGFFRQTRSQPTRKNYHLHNRLNLFRPLPTSYE
jgi:hypothetical protein